MEASKLPVRIRVSRKDIALAIAAENDADVSYRADFSCPIAQAVRRRFLRNDVRIGAYSANLPGFPETFEHSPGVTARIQEFDTRSVMEPFTLRIDPRRKTISVA